MLRYLRQLPEFWPSGMRLNWGQNLSQARSGIGTDPSENSDSSPGLRTDQIEVVALQLRSRELEAWDRFAQNCDASYRSASSWLKLWSLKHALRYRLELLEFYRVENGSRHKIGQCAVGVASSEHIVLDRLQIRPSDREEWIAIASALLHRLGPGQYSYGWVLNLEAPREDELSCIPGVAVTSVRPLVVQAVDFSQWTGFDEYWASTSTNTRRNAKRAKTEIRNLTVAICKGMASLRHVVPLVRLRTLTCRRKGLEFRALKAGLSYFVADLGCPGLALSAIASAAGRPLAGFYGMEFGTHTYYTSGGSRRDNRGAAWFLQKSMLQRAWDRHPGRAKFIMGYVDYATHDENVGGGLLRSKRALKVTDYPTSMVSFTYS
jgi:Acetyltransferase (GNAT) domain